MRAPADKSSATQHSETVQLRKPLFSGCSENNKTTRLRLLSTLSPARLWLCFSSLTGFCVVESDANECHINVYEHESGHHESGLNTNINLVNAGENP